MQKKWWKKVSSWAVILPVFAAIITGGVKIVEIWSEDSTKEIIQKQVIMSGKTVGTSEEILTTEETKDLERSLILEKSALISGKEND